MATLNILRCAAILASLALLVPAPAAAQTDSYPSKPITIVVGYPPGGSTDLTGRTLANELSKRLGVPVVIENVGGAGGAIGPQKVVNAMPDGYTLLVGANNEIAISRLVSPAVKYQLKDFTPIGLIASQPMVLVASQKSGVKTVEQFLGLVKKNPGKFNFSSTGVGSLSQLGVELLKVKTDTFAVHIPYASSPLAILAILQGDVQFACVPAVAVIPQVKAGKLRTLAVSTAKRSQLTPDIPTMKEAGLSEIENLAWMALMAPASTPNDIVQRMNTEINAVLAMPKVKDKLHAQYMEPIGGSVQDLQRFMQQELKVMTPVIKRTGVTME